MDHEKEEKDPKTPKHRSLDALSAYIDEANDIGCTVLEMGTVTVELSDLVDVYEMARNCERSMEIRKQTTSHIGQIENELGRKVDEVEGLLDKIRKFELSAAMHTGMCSAYRDALSVAMNPGPVDTLSQKADAGPDLSILSSALGFPQKGGVK